MAGAKKALLVGGAGPTLAASPADGLGDVKGSDISDIVYTPGSTGMPKGVLVTHAQTYLRYAVNTPSTPGADDVYVIARETPDDVERINISSYIVGESARLAVEDGRVVIELPA